MDEKNIISDEKAKALLSPGKSRLKAIENIRRGGYERAIGWVIAGLMLIVLLLMKSAYTEYYILLCIIVSFAGQQRWNEKRFDALVDFLEKEGIIRK